MDSVRIIIGIDEHIQTRSTKQSKQSYEEFKKMWQCVLIVYRLATLALEITIILLIAYHIAGKY